MRNTPGSTLPTPERDGQHTTGGRSLNTQNPIQSYYDSKLAEMEKNFGDTASTHQEDQNAARARDVLNPSAAVRDKEQQGSSTAAASPHPTATRRRRGIKMGIKGKSSIIAAALTILGGGSFLTVFLSPSMIIVQMKEVLTHDLNDQLKAMTDREKVLLRAKLKTVTKGSCGTVKIACRFSTMTDKQVEKLKKAGIEVDRDISKGFGGKRGQVTEMRFTDPDTGKIAKIATAADLTSHSMNNVAFRAAMLRGFNPTFAGVSDKVANKVLRAAKATKKPQITGKDEEERKKNLNSAVANGVEGSTNTLRPVLDKDGKPTGEYLDDEGHKLSAEEAEKIRGSAVDTEKIGPSKSVFGRFGGAVGKGLSVTGVADNACAIYNGMRGIAATAKTVKKAQAIRFAMGAVLAVADKTKAGDGDAGENETAGNLATHADMREKVVDESKADEAGSADNPPMIDNPDYGKSAFDSPGMKAALHGDISVLDSRAARFALGWGLVGTLDKANQLIAKAIAGPNATPKTISKACRTVQNPFVRVGGLALGIIVGAGTFGLATAAGIAGSLLISALGPYVMAQAAEGLAGKTFQDLEGMDFGDGAFVGTSAYLGDVAQQSGMKPLSSEEAADYTAKNKEVYAQLSDNERYLARTTPFDISNQFSFAGSLVRTLASTARTNSQTIATSAFSFMRIIPVGLLSSIPQARAADSIQRFSQCSDPMYKEVGIGADLFCNVRYGLSDEELAMDPVENAQWMATTGNIDPESETGDEKDNGQKWNYVKFLKECAHRTTGWGEDQDENEGDGGNCRSDENEAANKHFRVYTMDRRVGDIQDEEKDEELPGTTGVGGGQTGAVSTDGWAYPTLPSVAINSGYKTSERPDHRGVDMAAALGTPIFAARDGRVVAAGPADGFGNWIVVESQVDGKTVSTVYGHMSRDGVLVRQGDTVKAGQQIGKIGSEGQSSGPHLHFEIWEGSRMNIDCGRSRSDCTINPQPILDKAKQATRAREVQV